MTCQYKCEVFFISIAVAYITYATVYIEAGRIFQLQYIIFSEFIELKGFKIKVHFWNAALKTLHVFNIHILII